MLISSDVSRIRQFQLSREMIRTAIGAVLLGGAALASLGAGVLHITSEDVRVQQLESENALLRQQVAHFETQSRSIESEMAELAQRDQAFRLVAGLEPVHTDVLLAGVGGPGTATLEEQSLYQLDQVIGTRTFEVDSRLDALVRRARILAESWNEATSTLAGHHNRLAATPSILPARGFLTSSFTRSRMHPILHVARPHEGIDITAPAGTPIRAAADGTVAFAGRNGNYGLMVEIDHGHGYITRYAHASKLMATSGQRVKRGDVVAAVGSTGLSVGPHLHYEVLVKGRPADPRSFIIETRGIPD